MINSALITWINHTWLYIHNKKHQIYIRIMFHCCTVFLIDKSQGREIKILHVIPLNVNSQCFVNVWCHILSDATASTLSLGITVLLLLILITSSQFTNCSLATNEWMWFVAYSLFQISIKSTNANGSITRFLYFL